VNHLEQARRISDACVDPFRQPIDGLEVRELPPMEALLVWQEFWGETAPQPNDKEAA
jgi:hypothetical protein